MTEHKGKPDLNLIGQFGVGFYSAFMVAKRVLVTSRSYEPNEQGWQWSSEGEGGYEMEPANDAPRGTTIVVHLKDEEKDYAKDWRVEGVIKRYSNFVPFPIELNEKPVNTVQAIWARNKSEIKEEEYDEFYKYFGHDSDKPFYRLHFSADAPLAIQALLYVPSHNVELLGTSRLEPEVSLYSKKVLIQAHAKGLLPEWLRFLRGVVDSEDIPLNISRETMQDSSLIQKLNKVITSRFIKFLEDQATKDAALYEKFFKEFGRFLKEGVIVDFTHRDALAKLLCFESSTLPKGQHTSLSEYISRMPAEQKEIYFHMAANREAAESSPYFEVFSARKFEVLFFYDNWDEFAMDHLHTFEGKNIKAAERADLSIDPPQSQDGLSNEIADNLAKWMKDVLKDAVNSVRSSKRLVDSPAVVVDQEQAMTRSMRHILKQMRKEGGPEPEHKLDLELNQRHPIIVQLEQIRSRDETLATKVAEQIFDNARVAAGLLEDPRAMLKRMNELLQAVLEAKK
jgi:molecular chaperone HtpG